MLTQRQMAPATMEFIVSRKMEPYISTSCQLPAKYRSYAIENAAVNFVKGPFGCYITQQLQHEHWTICWQHFFIDRQILLYGVTQEPMANLTCALEGSFPCRLEGYGKVLVSQHTFGFYYIPPLLHHKILLKKGTYEMAYISISTAHFSRFMDQHVQLKEVHQRQQMQLSEGDRLPAFRINTRVRQALESIRQCTLEGYNRHIFLESRVNDILLEYYTALVKPAHYDRAQIDSIGNKISRIAAYIEEHYPQPLSTASLAAREGISLSTMEREFKKQFGHTPHYHLQQCRIKEASALLISTDLSVCDICYQVGFSGPNYFSKVFREHYSCAPLQYRKLNKS